MNKPTHLLLTGKNGDKHIVGVLSLKSHLKHNSTNPGNSMKIQYCDAEGNVMDMGDDLDDVIIEQKKPEVKKPPVEIPPDAPADGNLAVAREIMRKKREEAAKREEAEKLQAVKQTENKKGNQSKNK
jgi:hypothetical protein